VAKAIASKKKAERPEQTEKVASRTRARRPTGRTSAKLNEPAAKKAPRVTAAAEAPAAVAPRVEPEMIPVLQPVAETPGAAEPATRPDEAATVLNASAVEALAPFETEIVLEASEIIEETTIATPFAPPPPSRRRALVKVASRLLSTLRRWTGARS
jgi:hypothetical protein